MIDLPPHLLLRPLEAKLKRGVVWRTLFQFEKHDQFKRMVILNNQFSSDNIYFIFTTKEVEYYKRNKDCDLIRSNTLFFYAGETFLNPNEDMVIDCRVIRQISKMKLAENLQKGHLNFLGEMPRDIMGKIDNILRNSILIPSNKKSLILIN